MQFNNTTLKNGIIQRYEKHTLLGAGVVSGDTDLLIDATNDVNETVYDITSEIMLMQDSFDWDDPYKSDYPIATTPLVAGQRDYQFDSISFLKLKRVDVTYDGVNWVRATAFDSASIDEGLGNDSKTDQEFTTDEPMYDPKAFGFWLYPRATAAQVALGAKARIEFSRGHTEYVSGDTTKEAPIDRPYHDLIAIGAALKNTNITNDQYTKLTNMFGVKQPDGSWTGGMGRLINSYAQRNEDTFLDWNVDLRGNYT